MAAPPGHRAGVASCMERTVGDMELRKWSDKSVGDDMQVHHHRFGGEAAREQVSGLRDRAGDSRSLGHPVWEVQGHTGQENLGGTQPD
jgi:hypothetical protein